MVKIIVAGLFLSAAGMSSPISCSSEDSAYALWVDSNQKTAEVTINGEVPRFGKLVCSERNPESLARIFLSCRSPVADAGYSVSLYFRGTSFNSAARIGKNWIGGLRPLADLPCVEALH